jgi:hypothetical protein
LRSARAHTPRARTLSAALRVSPHATASALARLCPVDCPRAPPLLAAPPLTHPTACALPRLQVTLLRTGCARRPPRPMRWPPRRRAACLTATRILLVSSSAAPPSPPTTRRACRPAVVRWARATC